MSKRINIIINIRNNGLLEMDEILATVDLDEFLVLDKAAYRVLTDKVIANACNDLRHNLRSYFDAKQEKK